MGTHRVRRVWYVIDIRAFDNSGERFVPQAIHVRADRYWDYCQEHYGWQPYVFGSGRTKREAWAVAEKHFGGMVPGEYI